MDLDFLQRDDDLETVAMPKPGAVRRAGRAKMLNMMKRQALADVMPEAPEPGFTYHLISNGNFDFWTWIPTAIDWYGKAEEFYASTWTLNRTACNELLDLCDAGKIEKVSMLTGLYFKRRESAVYATLLQGLQARNHRYKALKNHAKVALIRCHPHSLCIEGSANWSANPRVEQYVLTDDPDVYEFHKAWMEEVFAR